MTIEKSVSNGAHIWMVNQYAITSERSGGTRHISLSKRLIQNGWRVSIIASNSHHQTRDEHQMSSKIERQSLDGIDFYWIKLPQYAGNSMKRIWNMLYYALSLFPFVLKKVASKPDVIYASSPHLFGAFAALLIAKFKRVPFVLEIRDLWPQTFIDLGGYSKWHPYIVGCAVIEKILYRHADRIVTLLPGSELYMKAKGADITKIHWIPNGIDFSMLEPVVEGSIEKSTDFVCIYAGAHGLANALDTVVDAAKIVLKHPDGAGVRFEFYGQGPERYRLNERLKSERIYNVRIHGPISKKDVYKVILESDVMLESKQDTPLYQWGMSFNKIFDYFACKKPVIIGLSAKYNPVDVCGAGKVVPPEDSAAMAVAILELKSLSPEALDQMGQRGCEYVREHHDFDGLALKLDNLLRELI